MLSHSNVSITNWNWLEPMAGLTGYGYGQVPLHWLQWQDPQIMEPHGFGAHQLSVSVTSFFNHHEK